MLFHIGKLLIRYRGYSIYGVALLYIHVLTRSLEYWSLDSIGAE